MTLCKATLQLIVTDADGTDHHLFANKKEGEAAWFLTQGDELKCVRRLQLILGAALEKLDTQGRLAENLPITNVVDKSTEVE